MRAGKLDRRLTLQRYTETGRDAVNAPVMSWVTLATVWGRKVPAKGTERFAAAQVSGNAVTTFEIRYRGDLTVKDRIVCEGRTYEVNDIREIGRRIGEQIDCIAAV